MQNWKKKTAMQKHVYDTHIIKYHMFVHNLVIGVLDIILLKMLITYLAKKPGKASYIMWQERQFWVYSGIWMFGRKLGYSRFDTHGT